MAYKRILSFKYAFEGIYTAFIDEPNLRIQTSIGLAGLLLGLYFQISTIEWLLGIISFSLVFCLELTNTAIEELINSFTQSHHPGAKKAKDVAAAAVMVSFFAEIIIGAIIFLPYII